MPLEMTDRMSIKEYDPIEVSTRDIPVKYAKEVSGLLSDLQAYFMSTNSKYLEVAQNTPVLPVEQSLAEQIASLNLGEIGASMQNVESATLQALTSRGETSSSMGRA